MQVLDSLRIVAVCLPRHPFQVQINREHYIPEIPKLPKLPRLEWTESTVALNFPLSINSFRNGSIPNKPNASVLIFDNLLGFLNQ